MRNHLQHCQHFQHLYGMASISDHLFDDTIADNDEEELSQPWFARHALENGIKILDSDSNWNRLLYKEALCIERNDPSLNRGLKASRQLKLFR